MFLVNIYISQGVFRANYIIYEEIVNFNQIVII